MNQTGFAVPQRVAAGIDPKRLTIILALLEKFGGVSIGASDVFATIAGGMKVTDASSDLALALAIASNHLVRSVSLLDQRIKEAIRLGMVEAVVPANGRLPENLGNMKVVRIRSLSEAISWLMDKK